MATWGEIAVGGVLVVGLVGGVTAWEHSKKQNEDEKRNRDIQESMRESSRREYERRQEEEKERRSPCGGKVEMLDSSGNVYDVCERDVPFHESVGRIRRVVKR